MAYLRFRVFLLLYLINFSFGQITGKVTAVSGSVISGAMVSYVSTANRLTWTYTDAAGNFSLGNPTTGIGNSKPSVNNQMNAVLSGSEIQLNLFQGKKLEWRIYNVHGHVLTTGAYISPYEGRYAFSPTGGMPVTAPEQMYFVEFKQGTTTSIVRWNLIRSGNANKQIHRIGATVEGFSKMAATHALDQVRIGRTGFKPQILPIDSYQQNLNTIVLQDNSVETRVDSLLATMSTDEIVGQLVMSDFAVEFNATNTATNNATNSQYITQYMLGSQMSKGDMQPVKGNEPQFWFEDITRIQTAAQATTKKIPLLVASDLIHGANSSTGTVIMPHNIGLGASGDSNLVERVYRVTAIESRGLGYNWTFAPAVSIPRHLGWGRVYEGYAETTDLTRIMTRAAIRGIQGGDLSHPYSMAGCVKHFVGDGSTTGGVDGMNGTIVGDNGVTLTDQEILNIHLPPYQDAVNMGIASVMPSLSKWKGTNLTIKKEFVTDLLKTQMGFKGFVQGDYEAHWRAGGAANGTRLSAEAGLDLPMTWRLTDVPKQVGEFKAMWPTGEARLRDAAKRILRIKFQMGLFDKSPMPDANLLATVGSAAHRAVGREAVRKSLVLLKNAERTPGGKHVLPLTKGAHIHLMGRHANDIGLQCGGWTIKWQGREGAITTGTTIKQGFEQVGGGTITHSATADATADAIVAVIGEGVYAEMLGDVGNKDWYAGPPTPWWKPIEWGLKPEMKTIVTTAKAAGKPLVCVLMTGRPIDISTELGQCDAVVEAWYPGTEGAGVADVLYGNADFQGKLTHTWPTAYTVEPINIGDADYAAQSANILFPYGYGLNMAGAKLP